MRRVVGKIIWERHSVRAVDHEVKILTSIGIICTLHFILIIYLLNF